MEVALSHDSVDGLKTAFSVNQLKDMHANLVQAYEKVKAKTTEPACDVVESTLKKCGVHDDLLVLYCYDCKTFICRDCGLTNHKSHKYEYGSTAAPKKREELLQSQNFSKK